MARKKKTRRVYRLRDLLSHLDACQPWQAFVRDFETADGVLAAVNAAPTQRVGDAAASWGVHWLGWKLATKLGEGRSEVEYWDERSDVFDGWFEGRPVTDDARRKLIRLWIRYADKHGLYTEVPA